MVAEAVLLAMLLVPAVVILSAPRGPRASGVGLLGLAASTLGDLLGRRWPRVRLPLLAVGAGCVALAVALFRRAG
jgi:hypothetical protein